jgi:hypothetical protein
MNPVLMAAINPLTLSQGMDALAAALEAVSNATNEATVISKMITQAKSEGRDTFNDQEWASIMATQSQARQALVAAITAALNAH